MAKKQPQLSGPIDIDPETGRVMEDEEFESEQSLRDDQDAQLDAIIGEFEKGEENITFKASICRVPDGYKKGGKEEWCFDADSAEITGIRLKMRDEYGPGIYRIRVFRNNKQVRQFDYHIAKPNRIAATSNSDNPALNALAEQLRTMNENQNRLMERLLAGPAQSQAGDPMTIALSMMEKFSTMMKNMMPQQPAERPADLGEKSVDMLVKGMELAQGMGGSDNDSIGSIVKELAKNPAIGNALTNILTQRKPRQQNQPQPQPQLPRQTQQPDNPAEVGNQLQQAIRYLIGRAALNKDPALYAEWLLDNLPPEFAEKAVSDPTLLDQLTPHFPRLTQYRQWFEELLKEANALMVGEGIPESEGENGVVRPAGPADGSVGRTDGDAPNPQADGALGAGGEA